MIKNKPQTTLSRDILESIFRKTGFIISKICIRDGLDQFSCSDFIWNHGKFSDETPSLIIFTIEPECPVVNLFWNGKFNEEFEIESNIPWSAEENLQFYIKLEKTVYPVLEKFHSGMVDLIELKVPEPRS